MRKIDIKSFLLGVGLAVIVLSMVSIISTGGLGPLTDDQIKERAKALGMIDKIEETPTPGAADSSKQNSAAIKATPAQSPTPKAQQATVKPSATQKPETVVFSIYTGDTSLTVAKKLVSLGLIKDATQFDNMLIDKNKAAAIKIGKYAILKGTSMEDIIYQITK